MSAPTTSTVPVVLDQFRDLLTESVTPVPVYDAPDFIGTGKDWINLGDIQSGDHEWPVMKAGRKKREEDYNFDVHITTQRKGRGPRAARIAAFELMASIENLLAEDPAIGLGDQDNMPTLRVGVDTFKMDTTVVDTNLWRVHLTLEIRAQVRLA